jgi:hypothetical protein
MVVVPSFGLAMTPDVGRSFGPLLPAYEERLLVLLLLLDQPAASLVYLTSQPVHPRIVDYYLVLQPHLRWGSSGGVVAASGSCLVTASPARPAEDRVDVRGAVPDESGE